MAWGIVGSWTANSAAGCNHCFLSFLWPGFLQRALQKSLAIVFVVQIQKGGIVEGASAGL